MSASIKEAFRKAKIVTQPKCPYCGNDAVLVKGDIIYPHRHDLHDLNFWNCSPCKAYVGCHKKNDQLGMDGTEPLGRLADAELRTAKSEAHQQFDPLWKEGMMKRIEAYEWLAASLGIPLADCHIGNFDVDTCGKVAELSFERYISFLEGDKK